MNKLCNFRPLFFACVSVLVGLLSSYFLLIGNFLGLIISTVSVIAILIILNLIKVFSKKQFIMLGICIVLFLSAFAGLQLNANTFNVSNIETSTITGYVSKINGNSGYQILTLTRVKSNNKRLSKNVTIYVSGVSEIIEGNNISFQAPLEKQKLVSNNKLNTYMVFNNTAYSTAITSDNVEILNYSPTIPLKIKNYVLNILNKNYSSKNSALVFAMLFGNKTLLSDFDVSSYNDVGIAHIFAVSGLHISIIFLIISFVLSRLMIRGKLNFIITAIISIIYCSLCSFSPSVVRATVMSLCLLFAKTVHKQGDSFNAFCIAFLILSLINPFNFLNAGFQLSFLCVFSILSLSPILSKIFAKKLPLSIANSLAVSISAFIGTFIVLVKIYGFFNPLSIVFNMLLIPVFSVLFIVIFVFNLVACLIPPLSFINQVPNFLLTIYGTVVNFLSKIPSVITLNNLGTTCLISFIIFIFIAGNFCLFKKLTKRIVCCALIIISLLSGIICSMPSNFNYISLTAIRSTYENCYLLTDTNNSRIFVVNNLNSASVKSITTYLTENKISYLTHIVARKVSVSQSQLETLQKLTKNAIITLQETGFETFEEYQQKQVGNFKFQVLNSILKENSVVATINNKNILFTFTKLNGAGNEEYYLNFSSFEIICSPSINNTTLQSENYIVFNQEQTQNENVIITNKNNYETIKF